MSRRYCLCTSPNLWCEINEIFEADTLPIVGWGLGRVRLRSGKQFPRHIRDLNRTFLNRPDWFASESVEHIQPRLLTRLSNDLPFDPIDHHISNDRRTWKIPVPYIVMDCLKMPQSFPCFNVNGHQTVRKQIITMAMTTVVIIRWHLRCEVHDPFLEICTYLSPNAGVSSVTPRIIQPTVVAKLVISWNCMKNPFPRTCIGIEPTNIALGVSH